MVTARSVPVVRWLVEDATLGLVVLTDGADLEQSLRYVVYTELPDPAPYLGGGELVLTSGRSLSAEGPDLDAFVLRLVRRRVVGLGFGVERVHARVPARLLDVAARAGLPVLEVPRATAFAAVSRTATELVAGAERRAVERPLDAHRRLLAAARGEDDAVVPVVEELAAVTGGQAVVLGPDAGLRHRAGGADDRLVAAAREEVEVLRRRPGGGGSSSFSERGAEVVVYPVTAAAGRSRAWIVLRAPVGDAEFARSTVAAALTLLALLAEQEDRRIDLRRSIRTRVADLVVDGEIAAAEAVAATADLVTGRRTDRERIVALAVAAAPTDVLLDEEDCYVSARDGDLVVLAPPPSAERLRGVLAATPAAIGVSRPVPFVRAHEAVLQATRARPTRRGTRTYDELVRQDLPALVDPGVLAGWAAELLGPVEHDLAADPDLEATLRSYLAHHGQLHPTARALGIHRHTVRHRVERLERSLGRPLDDADLRAHLWFALAARRH